MTWLFRYSIDHPFRVICAAVCVTLGAAPGLCFLELRTDGHALVPERSPEVAFDRSVRAAFGIEDLIVVVVRSSGPSGVFNPASLRLVSDLTRDISRVGVLDAGRISSLATEPSVHYRSGTLDFRRLLEPLPASQEDCDRIRQEIQALQIFTGTLVSHDGGATAIHIGVPEAADRAALSKALQDLAFEKATAFATIHVIGAPVAEALLGVHILEDLGVPTSLRDLRLGLLPAAVAVMSLVFLLSFRRMAAVLLPLSEVGACLVFVFGLMGWFGVPVYLTITILPVILTVTGVTDEIHLFSGYRRRVLAEGEANHSRLVAATMEELSRPVLKTALTTAIGFLSFAASPLAPVRAFGLFTAIGTVFCLLWSMTVIPALLTVLKPSSLVAGSREGVQGRSGGSGSVLQRLMAVVTGRPRWVLAAALALVALTPAGLRRLEIQDSWVAGFSEGSEFYRATQAFNSDFFGTHVLQVLVDSGQDSHGGELGEDLVGDHELELPADLVPDPSLLVGRTVEVSRANRPGASKEGVDAGMVWTSWIESAQREEGKLRVRMPRHTGSPRFLLRFFPGDKAVYRIAASRFQSPEVIRLTDELAEFLRAQGDKAVGGVLGPADYLRTTNFILKKLDPAAREIPPDPTRIDSLWRAYRAARGEKRLRESVDAGFDRALVTAYLKNANFEDTSRLMDALRAYEREHLKPRGIRLGFAGDVAVSQAMIQGIVSTQVSSLGLSLLGNLLVVSILGRSLLRGVCCMIPCSVAVLFNFALMGWLGMTLGVATSMFAAITLGIGVDFAIHLLDRFQLARSRGLGRKDALADAVYATGPAIIVDALAVALGFGVLLVSRVPANANLGIMAMSSILLCLASTLVLLPALLAAPCPSRKR